MKQLDIKILLAASALLFNSCQPGQTDTTPKRQPLCISDSLQKIIKIDTAVISNVNDELMLSGEVSFNDNKVVKVFPFSSGQVTGVMVSLGDKVSKGQTLAVIKSADVAGNYSDLSTAGNDVAITNKQMESAESLFRSGLGSEKEFVEAKEAYLKAVSAAGKFKTQIAINGGGNTSANGSYTIKSPINGYVVEKKINQGGFIRTDNSDNLFTVGDIRDVWVWANVYETDIARVKEGYAATITTLAYPGKTFKGMVDKVNEVLDPLTKVMKIRIKLSNDSLQLKPEMFANIMITNKEGLRTISVPASSIISDNGKNYVVVYRSNCDLAIREVQVLKNAEDRAYIAEGLSTGDKIISSNQILLYNALKE